MRWQEPLQNIQHLSSKINNKEQIEIVSGDLTDMASLLRILNDHRPEFIFHLAAQSFPRHSFDAPIETLQTNIIGTANLLEAVRILQLESDYDPVVHVCSSSEVYGKVKHAERLTEDSKFHGASPYSISKIGTDYLGQFYGEAYGIKTFVTRMGTHSGPRRSDVFFESTLAKQVAMAEAGLIGPTIKLGNLNSIRTFQDARDAIRAYYLLALASADGKILPGDCFNIAGEESFKLAEIVEIVISMSTLDNIAVEVDKDRLRPIDADYQMFDNTKIKAAIDWQPEIKVEAMLKDLLNYWRTVVASGVVPLDR
jgi:GDPmannose 4,6-dehydratase